jgi:hypothetical protein
MYCIETDAQDLVKYEWHAWRIVKSRMIAAWSADTVCIRIGADLFRRPQRNSCREVWALIANEGGHQLRGRAREITQMRCEAPSAPLAI